MAPEQDLVRIEAGLIKPQERGETIKDVFNDAEQVTAGIDNLNVAIKNAAKESGFYDPKTEKFKHNSNHTAFLQQAEKALEAAMREDSAAPVFALLDFLRANINGTKGWFGDGSQFFEKKPEEMEAIFEVLVALKGVLREAKVDERSFMQSVLAQNSDLLNGDADDIRKAFGDALIARDNVNGLDLKIQLDRVLNKESLLRQVIAGLRGNLTKNSSDI